MYATKEKGKDEPLGRSETKEGAAVYSQDGKWLFMHITLILNTYYVYKALKHTNVCCFVLVGSSSPHLFMELMDGNIAHSGIKPSSQASQNKDLERLRLSSTANQIPNMVPPGPSSSFPRPIYPVPLLSHVPMVRPPPQLHPNVIQRMLAQGIQPQQLGPALVQAG